jgi:DNA ligase-1
MLAHKYSERGDSITFPAYLQPKLDGHRCTAEVVPDDATLWTRSRKPISSMPHIAEALVELFTHLPGKILPDGELYNHTLQDAFEELTHFVRSSSPAPGYEIVQYHVFDVYMPGTFEERFKWLESVFSSHNPKGSPLHLVHTIRVEDEDEMMTAFRLFRKEGYEGAIIRNAGGSYLSLPPPKRSVDLQKVKEFDDDEFKVIGVEEGRGKMAGLAVFVCEAKNGNPFNAKMEGPLEELAKYFKHPEKYIGKQLTVRYQGLTTKNKVPRFPVAERFAEKL